MQEVSLVPYRFAIFVARDFSSREHLLGRLQYLQLLRLKYLLSITLPVQKSLVLTA
jgi:hypothetical protein